MKLHVGQILKYKDSNKTVKVLEVLTGTALLSFKNRHDGAWVWCTHTEIEKDYEIPEEVWEPKFATNYYFIDSDGEICRRQWSGGDMDIARKDFLGVYETEEKAEKALEDIKIKLKK